MFPDHTCPGPRHGTEPGSAPGHKEQGLKRKKIPKGRYYNEHAKPKCSQIGFGLHKAGALKHTTLRHGAFSPFACSPMQQQSHGFKSHFTEFSRPFVCLLSAVCPGKVLELVEFSKRCITRGRLHVFSRVTYPKVGEINK